MAKKSSGGRESKITSGGIETSVEGFFGNILTSSPAAATYGDHKKIGSEMAPTTAAGRGAKEKMRGSLYNGGKGAPK